MSEIRAIISYLGWATVGCVRNKEDVSSSCREGNHSAYYLYLCLPGMMIGGGAAKCFKTL